MLKVREIFKPDADHAYIENLLERAFPVYERRPFDALRKLLGLPGFHCNLLLNNDAPAGVLNWWELPGFNYCEHLAINPAMRGTGLGTQALQWLLTQGPLLLEVEPPETEEAVARIRFYERCGLQAWPEVSYQQPPYAPGLDSATMLLMASSEFERKEAEAFIKILKEKVYGC